MRATAGLIDELLANPLKRDAQQMSLASHVAFTLRERQLAEAATLADELANQAEETEALEKAIAQF